MSTGAQTWEDGGTYLWEINASNDAGGTQGADPGWDWLDITGTLELGGLSAGGFTIDIDSLTQATVAGDAAGFDYLAIDGNPSRRRLQLYHCHSQQASPDLMPDNFTLDSSGF